MCQLELVWSCVIQEESASVCALWVKELAVWCKVPKQYDSIVRSSQSNWLRNSACYLLISVTEQAVLVPSRLALRLVSQNQKAKDLLPSFFPFLCLFYLLIHKNYGLVMNPWPPDYQPHVLPLDCRVFTSYWGTGTHMQPTTGSAKFLCCSWMWVLTPCTSYTISVLGCNKIYCEVYTLMASTNACKYIKISLYSWWTHTCFGLPCDHHQWCKMQRLDTVRV